MPRPYRGPKLWLDTDRKTWTIIDRRARVRTGFSEHDYDEARKALKRYADSIDEHPSEYEPPEIPFEFDHNLTTDNSEMITLREAAEKIFGGCISPDTLRRELKIGRLIGFRIGGRVFTTVDSATRLYEGTMKLKRTTKGRGVYVVGFGPYIKIGITQNIKARVASLQAHTPETVTVHAVFVGWRRDEILLHRRFGKYRMNGEWFRKDGTLADWIDGGCQ